MQYSQSPRRAAAFGVVLVGLALAARLLYLLPYPKPLHDGAFPYSFSPDSSLVATAIVYQTKRFWGGSYLFTEYVIAQPDMTPVRSFVVVPPHNEVVDYSDVGPPDWSADGSSIQDGIMGFEVVIQAQPFVSDNFERPHIKW